MAKLSSNGIDARAQRDRDLGFGGKAAESRERLLNRDGSFNVERHGIPFLRSLNLYHVLLTMSWLRFNLMVVVAYGIVNFVFAWIYVLVGTEHLVGIDGRSIMARFSDAFFFSTQTFTTVGYGRVSPVGFWANSIAAIESMAGLLGFALATGLLYGRFSRPTAKILFSKVAVIAPYQGITGFMFRSANERSNQLLEVEAEVNLSLLKNVDGKKIRQFFELELERRRVNFFHLSWTIVHPITEASPLYGMNESDLRDSDAEFFILFTAFDDTFSQTVHARTSYKPHEIRFDHSFSKIIYIADSGKAAVDLDRIHDTEIAAGVPA